MQDPSTQDSRRLADSLLAEQVESMCKNLRFALPISCLLALGIFAMVRDRTDPLLISGWFISVVAVNVARYYVMMTGKPPHLQINPRRFAWIHVGLALVAGIVWAVVPALLLISDGAPDPFVIMILSGITAGGTVQSVAFALVGQVFVFPILATLVVRFAAHGGQAYYIVASSVILYLCFLIRSVSQTEGVFRRTVILKIEATALAASLEREHEASIVATERLYQLANHDPLTGLANRTAFALKLQTWLDEAGAAGGTFFLFLLDLDHFKSINDTLGHSAGDTVLKNVATRISAALPPGDVVARLGGDEFAIIVADITSGSMEALQSTADQLIERASGRVFIGEYPVTIGVSIGIAKFPDDGTSAESLLAHADLALYAAKDAGRRRWRRFDSSLLATATMARDIEHDLAAAMADGSLQVWFQPQISLNDHRLAGLECLLRWNHPIHGWIAPPRIVAAALRSRTCEGLTGFVLDQACRQIRSLDAAGRDDVIVAVNMSPSEVDHYILSDLVQRMIDTHGIDPSRLEIEITEEAFAATETTLATLTALAQTGVHLAIDDFGTGYSSIAYLSSMRVNRIKIDRGFVTGFADRAGDRILVQAILGLGRSFGIEVLAEGVETQEEAVLLRAFGCRVAQGYHFGYPMNADKLKVWMAEHAEKNEGATLLGTARFGELPPSRRVG